MFKGEIAKKIKEKAGGSISREKKTCDMISKVYASCWDGSSGGQIHAHVCMYTFAHVQWGCC